MPNGYRNAMIGLRAALIGLGALITSLSVGALALATLDDLAAAVLVGLGSIPAMVRFLDRVIEDEQPRRRDRSGPGR